MKAAIYTLGCKVNTCESSEIASLLRQAGWQIVTEDEQADAFVVNSCTVTEESSRKSKQLLRRLRRSNPQAVLVLTGCYVQAFPEEAAALQEADLVIGHRERESLPRLLTLFLQNRESLRLIQPHEKEEPFSGGNTASTEGHTRAFLKIQDGCDRFCSYCIIPYARGRSRSASLERVRSVSRAFAANGYREIVLVGINLSAFGKDSGEGDLADAVAAASEPAGIVRVRLGSLEPDHLTPDLLERLSACRKLCGQFHISLQSGCDSVLRRMNRHYTAEEYDTLTQRLRAGFPDCSLTTDVICGFPGESEEEFAETVAFVKKIGFEKVHIFPYSPRSGTSAARRDGQIPKHEKQKRCAYLAKITENSRTAFFAARLGKIYDVLFETQKNGLWHGYTENYIPVAVKNEGTESLRGKILPVRLSALASDGCIGERLLDETENL